MVAAAEFDSLCREKCNEDFVLLEGSRSCCPPAASQGAEWKIKIWQQGSSRESPPCAAAPAVAAVAVAVVAASTAAG